MTRSNPSVIAVRRSYPDVLVAPSRLALHGWLTAAFRGAEWVFAAGGLLVFAGGLFTFVISLSPRLVAHDELLWKVAQAAVFAGTLGLVAVRPRQSLRTVPRHPATIALVAVAIASTTWSISPGLTLKRAVVLAGTTMFGVYLGSRFRSRELLLLLASVLGLTAVASLAVVVVMPAQGVSGGGHLGDWRGVYGHKNALGLHMALATLVFFLLTRELRRGRWIAWSGVFLCGVLVVFSRSITALVLTGATALSFPLLAAVRHRSMNRILVALAILAVGSCVAMVFAAAPDTILAMLGKESSLTGRLPLWAVLVEQWKARPWQGYGYGAFWTGWDSGPSRVVAQVTLGWYPWHAHNGFLNVALQLGVVGVALLLWGYASAVRRGLLAVRDSTSGAGFWPMTLLMFLFVASASESVFLRQDDFFWLLYVTTVFLAREATPPAMPGAAPGAFRRVVTDAPGRAGPPRPPAGATLSPGVRRMLGRRRHAPLRRGDG